MQLCGEKVILVVLPDAFRALLHAFSSRGVQVQSMDVRSMSSLATASGRATNRCVTGKLDARYSGCRCRSSAETTRDPTAGRYGAAHGGRGGAGRRQEYRHETSLAQPCDRPTLLERLAVRSSV